MAKVGGQNDRFSFFLKKEIDSAKPSSIRIYEVLMQREYFTDGTVYHFVKLYSVNVNKFHGVQLNKDKFLRKGKRGF